ncbi:MAG: hypothetical protein M1820_000731 [Bogoriella megaspora]|nr:MAG: hypothetical protein M1820_000731 [Bogoriella megaspora]
MFSKTSIFALTALVATAACSPFPNFALEPRTGDCPGNQTEYCSNSAGCACTARPSDCTATYLVQPDDTCTTIAKIYNNFTETQLYLWNPDIGTTCFGLQAYVPVCINTPWYKFTPPIQNPYGSHKTAAQVPVPVMPNIIDTCQEYEITGPAQNVASLSKENGFSIADFANWNGNATGTWQDYWACVKA